MFYGFVYQKYAFESFILFKPINLIVIQQYCFFMLDQIRFSCDNRVFSPLLHICIFSCFNNMGPRASFHENLKQYSLYFNPISYIQVEIRVNTFLHLSNVTSCFFRVCSGLLPWSRGSARDCSLPDRVKWAWSRGETRWTHLLLCLCGAV